MIKRVALSKDRLGGLVLLLAVNRFIGSSGPNL